MSAALVLALAPVGARAEAPAPDAVQPAPDPAAPPADPATATPATADSATAAPAIAAPPADPATAAPATTPSSGPVFAPVDIPAQPPLPKPEPPPAPEPPPEPIVAPVEGPPEPEGPSPEQREAIQAQRRAGIGVMSTGAMLAGAGLGMTIALTIVGDAAQKVEDPVPADIEGSNAVAKVGGVVIASGVALAAIGGIVFATAARKAKQSSAVASVRVAPALGGLVLSGRF